MRFTPRKTSGSLCHGRSGRFFTPAQKKSVKRTIKSGGENKKYAERTEQTLTPVGLRARRQELLPRPDHSHPMTAHSITAPFQSRSALLALGAGLVLCAGVAALGFWFHAHEDAAREWLSAAFETARGTPWALPTVVGVYVVLSFVCFPISILNIACAMVFGIWGIAYGLAGSMANAGVTFLMGRLLHGKFGKKILSHPKIKKADAALQKGGVVGAAATHLLPVLPFSVINIVAGLSTVKTLPYMLGTFIALLPGCIARGVLGDSLGRVLLHPTPETWMYVGLGVVLLAVTLAGAHVAVNKIQK